MRSADVIEVGPSVTNLGYNLRDSWWGVPRFGVMLTVVAKQFDQLREVCLSCKHALDGAVEVIPVCGDLEAIFRQTPAQTFQELLRGFPIALADIEVRHQLAVLLINL